MDKKDKIVQKSKLGQENPKLSYSTTACKDNFWDKIDEHVAKYGNISTPELDWGPDVGTEIIDHQ